MARTFHHLFGPVSSRRLGRSLGVDLTPRKTCCQDCVFCQLGPTRDKTITRQEFVPTGEVNRELDRWHRSRDWAKYITLSGCGEPTLHLGFGDVLGHIRSSTKATAVLLTNGALFWLEDVREAARNADIVKVSLSAWDQPSYENVNRPHSGLDFERILVGVHRFREAYSGQLWLEVFLVKDFNSSPDEVVKIAAGADRLRADRIHFNTVTRPPAISTALPLPEGEMRAMASLFHPKAELIKDPEQEPGIFRLASEDAVLAAIGRRPSTAKQLASAFNANANEIARILARLVRAGDVRVETVNGRAFFTDPERRTTDDPRTQNDGTASQPEPTAYRKGLAPEPLR